MLLAMMRYYYAIMLRLIFTLTLILLLSMLPLFGLHKIRHAITLIFMRASMPCYAIRHADDKAYARYARAAVAADAAAIAAYASLS